MIRPFNRLDVSQCAEGLSTKQRMAFIASCADRLSGFYHAFSLEESTGDVQALRSILDWLWRWSCAQEHEGAPQVYRNAIADLAPNPEAIYHSVFTPMAEYSCEIIEIGLELASNHEDGKIEDAAIVTQTAVEMYLAAVNQVYWQSPTVDLQQALSQVDYCALPLFQAELQKQQADCETLRKAGNVSPAVLDRIRNSGPEGVSPVRRFQLDARRNA